MADLFANTQLSLSSPASGGSAVVPSDDLPLPETSRALYLGSGGNLRVRMLAGDVLDFTNAATGMLLPIRVTQVLATGTTARDIIALF